MSFVMDVECPRCGGDGWVTVRRYGILEGLHEENCPRCSGTGVIVVDCETGDEVEDDE